MIHKLPGYLPVPPEEIDLKHELIPGFIALRDYVNWHVWGLANGILSNTFPEIDNFSSNIAMDGRLMDFNGLSCLFPEIPQLILGIN